MKREDLFLAIGMMDDSRLARTELAVDGLSVEPEREDKAMKSKTIRAGRLLRNVLIAAVLVSMLAVTVYATVGYLIFNSPEEMVTAIFGDKTGYDHSTGSIQPDPWGGPEGIVVEPTFDRTPADLTVVEADIVPYVDPVGQSLTWEGYTLTVDAFLYDSATKCGFFTYLLENPEGVDGYNLQTNGEIWYEGGPDIVSVNQYGYPYIIREKTTDTCLAATYYFRYDPRWGENLDISFTGDRTELPDEQIDRLLIGIEEELREELTGQEAIARVIDLVGQATFNENTRSVPDGMSVDLETWRADYAYTVLRDRQFRDEYQNTGKKLAVDLSKAEAMPNAGPEDGSVRISPISIQIDVTDLTFLHRIVDGKPYIRGDNVDSVVIRFLDGSEYVVSEGYTCNYTFAVTGSATDGEKDNYNMLTYMFNRIIDVDQVEAVVLNGIALAVE